ncbi:MAG TPA: Cu(I)-responsive transcriptional regulator [Alphaproteobacteria bacterium]|nr:Cu(I)-responsive transcriptional regulator [Alphaproteobacteria bacterium]
MNIGAAAEITGVPAKTIRYYEEIGLIMPARRQENGYRNYANEDIQILRFIQRSRRLGFSVRDVESLLTLWQDKDRASADVKKLALKHIGEVEKRIEEMQSIRETLLHLTRECHGNDRPDCPIIRGLAEGA